MFFMGKVALFIKVMPISWIEMMIESTGILLQRYAYF